MYTYACSSFGVVSVKRQLAKEIRGRSI